MDFVLLPPESDVLDLSDKINACHRKVLSCEQQSKEALGQALLAAWEAGRLLNEQKEHVEDGNWTVWLKYRFQGSARTAQRYMKLAKSIADESNLSGLSIRQAYLKCGISTSGSSRGEAQELEERCVVLPSYLSSLNHVLRWTREKGDPGRISGSEIETICRDFRVLYEWLTVIFTSEAKVKPAQLINSPK